MAEVNKYEVQAMIREGREKGYRIQLAKELGAKIDFAMHRVGQGLEVIRYARIAEALLERDPKSRAAEEITHQINLLVESLDDPNMGDGVKISRINTILSNLEGVNFDSEKVFNTPNRLWNQRAYSSFMEEIDNMASSDDMPERVKPEPKESEPTEASGS